ncbi:hypothetical protein [Neptuniibacter sp. CAU 1671]|uniref:DUF4870 family protein n=1 Tax=Neptuniibacter sp. CAU 1671 TaxID=3032593 RepID=UPI0023D9B498|nr:hypothetical protein [Neptuniibacter sp. CAU 1671]MDF2180682.1 hypothetical protein [Neptuniibacter sp. CAU 1671]
MYPQTQSGSSDQCKLIYILNLISLVFGITALVAVVMAYVYRSEAPGWLQSHYRFQIRTFWIGLLYGFISIALMPLVIGFPLSFLAVIWWIVRAVKGLQILQKGEAYPQPATWMF